MKTCLTFLFLISFTKPAFSSECECFNTCSFQVQDTETDFEDQIFQLEEIKKRLELCLRFEINDLKDIKEELYFHEVTALKELIDLYDHKNVRLKKLYEEVKDTQAKDWQRFLDWQDQHLGKYSEEYNEKFDAIAPTEKKEWHEKEADLKLISSLMPHTIDLDPVFKFWNEQRLKDVESVKDQIKNKNGLINKLTSKISTTENLISDLLSKL